MSARSFDETNGSELEKTVFDERQKALQFRFGIEAFSIFTLAVIFCCASIDFFYKWAESTTCAVIVIGGLCLLWYLIRCAVKGCMAAVVGNKAQKISFTLITVGTIFQSIHFVSQIGNEDFVLKDGMLSNDFLFLVSFMLLLGCGIFSLCVINREEKRNKSKEEEK